MEELFADTAYWIAMLDNTDALRKRAIELSKSRLPHSRLVSSDLVFAEVLNYFSKQGPVARDEAADLYAKFGASPQQILLPASPELLSRAAKYYRSFSDKSWSFTDCASFIIMQDRNIHDALTHDHHFNQAGFRALMRVEPSK